MASFIQSFRDKYINRRWEMVAMLFSGILVVYTLRVNMSVAAQDMRDELEWSEAEKGLVLSAFYWGYAVGQIPASRYVQIYGGKWIFGLSVLIPSVLTLFVPIACKTSFGLALFIRCIIGFFESASFPAVFYFFPVWVPLEEKTFMIPAIVSGMYMGEIVGFSLSGILVGSDLYIGDWYIGGWQSVFYVFGMLGVVWFPYWALMAYDSPRVHPKITAEELAFINKGKGYSSVLQYERQENTKSLLDNAHDIRYVESNNSPVRDYESNPMIPGDIEGDKLDFEDDSQHINNVTYGVPKPSGERERNVSIISDEYKEETGARIPWQAFFTHPVSLTLFINSWTFGWIGFTLLSEMPSYLTDVLGFNLESAGILCVFPYLALFISALSFGGIFEYLQKNYNWSTDKVRKVAQVVAYLGSVGGLLICGFMDDKYVAYAFMILTQLTMGAAQVGLGCAYSDVAPNYSSALNSVGNSIGAVAGIVGPLVIAAFTEAYPGVWGWRAAFFLTAVMGVISLYFWMVFQTSQPVLALNSPAPKRK